MPNPSLEKKNNTKTKKPARLGRGLGSLLSPDALEMKKSPSEPVPTKKASQTSAEESKLNPETRPPERANQKLEVKEENRIWHVPIDKIKGNKEQPRREFTPDLLKELASSIKQKGIIQPITVRKVVDGSFEIVAGERRWRAAQIAGLHEVPVIIKKIDKQASLELALIENIQRSDLNPVEESEAYDVLIKKYRLTQQEIADRVGKERATIANSLRLLSLGPEVKTYLKEGQISVGHAKVLLAVSDLVEQKKFAKKAIQQKLSVRALEQLVKSSQKKKDEDSIEIDMTQRLVEGTITELQKIMGRKVGIDYKQGKGKISLHYYSDEEFSDIIEKLKSGWKN